MGGLLFLASILAHMKENDNIFFEKNQKNDSAAAKSFKKQGKTQDI